MKENANTNLSLLLCKHLIKMSQISINSNNWHFSTISSLIVASIYANLLEQKKAFAYEKSSTPTGLVWNTNMAAVTSCKNTLYGNFVTQPEKNNSPWTVSVEVLTWPVAAKPTLRATVHAQFRSRYTTWLPWRTILFCKHAVSDGHSVRSHLSRCFVT